MGAQKNVISFNSWYTYIPGTITRSEHVYFLVPTSATSTGSRDTSRNLPQLAKCITNSPRRRSNLNRRSISSAACSYFHVFADNTHDTIISGSFLQSWNQISAYETGYEKVTCFHPPNQTCKAPAAVHLTKWVSISPRSHSEKQIDLEAG